MSKSFEETKRVSTCRGFLGYTYTTNDSEEYRKYKKELDELLKQGHIGYPLILHNEPKRKKSTKSRT